MQERIKADRVSGTERGIWPFRTREYEVRVTIGNTQFELLTDRFKNGKAAVRAGTEILLEKLKSEANE